MQNKPEEMIIGSLQVLVMPTGEIICNGKIIGYLGELGSYIKPWRKINGTEFTEEELKELE